MNYSFSYHFKIFLYVMSLRRGIYGSFFLSLSSCQLFKVKTSLFDWKHYHISFKWWFFHPIHLFEQKRCYLMCFSWRLDRKRIRGKSNHKFHAQVMSSSQNCPRRVKLRKKTFSWVPEPINFSSETKLTICTLISVQLCWYGSILVEM